MLRPHLTSIEIVNTVIIIITWIVLIKEAGLAQILRPNFDNAYFENQ
jgi:hypothetical protein